MLLQNRAVLNPYDCETVLRGACQKLSLEGVKALLDAGAEANRQGVGEAALYHAVYAECPEGRVNDKIALINLLLDAGADACDVDDGQSVLHMCTDIYTSRERQTQRRCHRLLAISVPRLAVLHGCGGRHGADGLGPHQVSDIDQDGAECWC
jgi:hypothetical protein